MPRVHFIEPQLATLVEMPPHREGWIHEVKLDGYRTLLLIEKGAVRACTRNGFDWSHRYPGIVRAAAKLKCKSAILDGEVIVQDSNGISDFEHLSTVIKWAPERLVFYAFDLVHLDGKDLREAPLLERRGTLKELLPPDDTRRIQFSEEFDGACRRYSALARERTRATRFGFTQVPSGIRRFGIAECLTAKPWERQLHRSVFPIASRETWPDARCR